MAAPAIGPAPPDTAGVPRLGWIAAGVGVAALTTGIVFWALAQNDASNARRLSKEGGDAEGWETTRDRAEDRVLLANVSFGLAGAAAATAVLVAMTW